MKPPPNLLAAFARQFGHAPHVIARAPGRVNLLGEHVDYSDGWVLPAAIDRCAWLAASPSPSPQVALHALDLDGIITLDLTALEDKLDIAGTPLPEWARYPAGVALPDGTLVTLTGSTRLDKSFRPIGGWQVQAVRWKLPPGGQTGPQP